MGTATWVYSMRFDAARVQTKWCGPSTITAPLYPVQRRPQPLSIARKLVHFSFSAHVPHTHLRVLAVASLTKEDANECEDVMGEAAALAIDDVAGVLLESYPLLARAATSLLCAIEASNNPPVYAHEAKLFFPAVYENQTPPLHNGVLPAFLDMERYKDPLAPSDALYEWNKYISPRSPERLAAAADSKFQMTGSTFVVNESVYTHTRAHPHCHLA